MEQSSEAVPSYYNAISEIINSTVKVYGMENGNASLISGFVRDLRFHSKFMTTEDYGAIFGGALLWTLVRYMLEKFIFSPYAKSREMTAINQKKFPESGWKLLVYVSVWTFTVRTLFSSQHDDIFYRPTSIWSDWRPGMMIEDDIWLIYILEASFYVHSVYATLIMDHKRKDTLVMLLHHAITFSLIFFSYMFRFQRIGLFVIFIHDVTDVILEFAKVMVYMKNRDNTPKVSLRFKIYDFLSNAAFGVFAVNWYVFRLYFFPLKVLYSTALGTQAVMPALTPSIWFFFNGLLWMLLSLNIWWFSFIVLVLLRIATGKMNELDDIREPEVEKAIRDASPKKKTH